MRASARRSRMNSRICVKLSACSERRPPCSVFRLLNEVAAPKSSLSMIATDRPRCAASHAAVTP